MKQQTIDAIWDFTNECYCKALMEEYPDLIHMNEEEEMDAYAMKKVLIENELPHRSPSINARYLAHLTKLSTEQLNLVLKANKGGQIKRSPITIEAIMTELFERAANSESKRHCKNDLKLLKE